MLNGKYFDIAEGLMDFDQIETILVEELGL